VRLRRHLAAATAAGAIAVLALTACGGGSGTARRSTSTAQRTTATAPATSSTATAPAPAPSSSADWTRFGVDPARTNVFPGPTGITAANVGRLNHRTIPLPGTVDSSPILVRGVTVGGTRHDLLVMTTTYGRTLALDAYSGATLWTFTPPGIGSWEGSDQITNATPVADPSSGSVYAASPDGRIHRLSLSDGRESSAGSWPVTITRDPGHEKIPAALNLAGGFVIATTGGYLGDAPPYQGHVVLIDARTGAIAHVFNALCSGRRAIIAPTSCAASGAAIWGRSGAVVDPATGHLLVATGNGDWDGSTDWGDSVLELSATADRVLGAFTPADQAALSASDTDLGSTAPVPLPGNLAIQVGKDGSARLLDRLRFARPGSSVAAFAAAQIQSLPSPGGQQVLAAPAVWQRSGGTLVFVAGDGGTTAYRLTGRRLSTAWSNGKTGTSPVLAGGLLWVYDPNGGLQVYDPSSGRTLASLPAGPGHWNSPVVAGGVVALPVGNANDHSTSGTLELFTAP
jgi:hypothetical protein